MPVDYSSVRGYRVKYIASQIIHADGTTERGNNVVGYIVSGPFKHEPAPPVIDDTTFENALQKVAYSKTMNARGGDGTFVWSASGLPTGLAIDSTTGIISGTPTTLGTFDIVITVKSAGLTDNKSFSLLVNIPPGIYWTSRTSPAGCFWRCVCYAENKGLFVAVAQNGTNRVMTSPDGITWTSRTSANNNTYWFSVCYAESKGLFVAVGLNCVMTSPDGITWTSRTSPANKDWQSVCYAENQGLFVAVTDNGVMTSPDGITWTSRTPAANVSWFSVCYAENQNLFVAVAYYRIGNRVMTSPDGITWTSRTPAANNDWRSVCYVENKNLFVAVGANAVMTSPDGITWTIQQSAA